MNSYLRKLNTRNIKKILIIQTAFIGDVILTTPLIEAAKKVFPDLSIQFLTIPSTGNIIKTHPLLDKVWIFDKRGKNRGIIKLFRFAKKLRLENFDLALVPHRSLRSALMAFGARIPQRIGFDRSAGAFLFTKKIAYRQDLHEVERNLKLLAPFQESFPKIMPRIYPDKTDTLTVDCFIAERALKSAEHWIAIAPGSVWATKRWLKEGYVELCNKLGQHKRLKIILIGGSDDKSLCEWIAETSKVEPVNAAGRFTLRQSAELIRRCRLIITNDSGPLHLGVAVGTQVIAIFGPTVPAFGFYPYSENDIIFEKDVSCRPCAIHGGHKCPTGTFLCMKSITANEIYEKILKILKI